MKVVSVGEGRLLLTVEIVSRFRMRRVAMRELDKRLAATNGL